MPGAPNRFILKHERDESQDIVAELVDDEDSKKIEWDGLPRSLSFSIGLSKYSLVKAYPLQMLNMVLNQQLENCRGPRPLEEIEPLLNESIEIRRQNPSEIYELLDDIGAGNYGTVKKVKRRRDGHLFAVKEI